MIEREDLVGVVVLFSLSFLLANNFLVRKKFFW